MWILLVVAGGLAFWYYEAHKDDPAKKTLPAGTPKTPGNPTGIPSTDVAKRQATIAQMLSLAAEYLVDSASPIPGQTMAYRFTDPIVETQLSIPWENAVTYIKAGHDHGFDVWAASGGENDRQIVYLTSAGLTPDISGVGIIMANEAWPTVIPDNNAPGGVSVPSLPGLPNIQL